MIKIDSASCPDNSVVTMIGLEITINPAMIKTVNTVYPTANLAERIEIRVKYKGEDYDFTVDEFLRRLEILGMFEEIDDDT